MSIKPAILPPLICGSVPRQALRPILMLNPALKISAWLLSRKKDEIQSQGPPCNNMNSWPKAQKDLSETSGSGLDSRPIVNAKQSAKVQLSMCMDNFTTIISDPKKEMSSGLF